MVPSPRKRAQPAHAAGFDQTWDHNDAAFLDPNTLPLAKIPRAWERRKDVKKLGQGKEKKIWRRFDLRSRASKPADEDEDEPDARSRAVKKLQHLSPKAMEKTTNRRRAFKATRWDRRKSVLPRKKTASTEDSVIESEDVDDIEDALDATEDNSLAVADPTLPTEHNAEPVHSRLLETKERRSTFTFTMDSPAVEHLPEAEGINALEEINQEPEPTYIEDATLTNFFRSPSKSGPSDQPDFTETVEYPQLPCNAVEVQTGLDASLAEADGYPQSVQEYVVQSEVIEESTPEDLKEVEQVPQIDASEDYEELITTPTPPYRDISYPDLPVESIETAMTPIVPGEAEEEEEDTEMSDVGSDNSLDCGQSDNAIKEGILDSLEAESSEEEFTEASIQLHIQRQYDEEQLLAEEESGEPTTNAPEPCEGESTSDDKVSTDTETFEDAESESLESGPSCSKDTEPAQPQRVSASMDKASSIPGDDITDGLTLFFAPAQPASADPTPRKLHSPPPPARLPSGPDDATMTIALDDDTALLKDFLTRAAASKAEKAAVSTHRRESLQNRRDSDVIRHALASPRKVLEDKDPNSPSKYNTELTLDLSQTLTFSLPNDTLASPTPGQADNGDDKLMAGSRRSSRSKKSRLPAPASQAQASKIAIRRADGNEIVVLKKTDAHELANLTRANTRKNKQGAFGVTVRLLKLAADAAGLPPLDESTKELIIGKNIRWDEQLAYYQENPEPTPSAADIESASTPDELSLPDESSADSKPKSKVSKNSTPKIRRVRGLGTANGTPGKGLLTPDSFLPEAVQAEKEAAQATTQQLPKPKASKTKKMPVASTSIELTPVSTASEPKLSTLEVAPVGVQPATQRKSRLAAPKKVILPVPASVSSAAAEGKENSQRPGLGNTSPRKGIPAPKVLVPPTLGAGVGMESGLPRRRGRKY
ncbi:hypothetical protein IQ07DRAFT_562460 [Pyrenochaeta sp. DS3sAY3a]|nr:hypothetical protein IQ07DRAFT_562460 [Pyrenochaeta sp. DS3sAY3a]